ncbi:PilZ domain-containing protein [Vibrio panuliri]|uniref:Cyclic diguanosine monophosphate-binding protein n=1 Tax=Vibrio panuliri TaxID=1381081 RepID=A0A1Q9H9M6_9VIBR|nr:PilZ domain-containing protein [Vibrio panuliri]KAB1460158.1 PilZ domain-containing protein [Vibrio panuliri]OLQ85573.1 pilus assembly protein PilZ [Vibrio panuliri]OLQ96417.1 pilus assembly protein PilZ [Vibrio panuliri]
MIERRRFSRIVYQAIAVVSQGENQVEASVKDLSLHGLLLSSSQSNQLDLTQPIEVKFQLPESDISIELKGRIISEEQGLTRVIIEHIDIDSISHIKRIIELNVGDDQLLHREIEQLSDLAEYS